MGWEESCCVLTALQSLYDYNKMCVRVGGEQTVWFESRVGLRQVCVVSPWMCSQGGVC